MSNFAIIKVGARQYKVSKGDVITVDLLEQKAGDKIVFDQVLLSSLDKNIVVGTPLVDKAKVEGKVIAEIKGDKVKISKFKAKSRYRKHHGHRAKLTKIEITKI